MQRQTEKRLTLKSVAAQLGVSTATLSNAFNRPSQLSQSLRDSLLQECKDIGYAGPHAQSRTLRTQKTQVIGVMLSNQLSYSFSDPVANQMLQGLSQVFEQQDYNILVVPSRRELKHLSGIESFVEGFIIYGPPAQDRLDELIFHKKSIIAIDFTMDGVVSINIDNKHAAFECASHAFRHKPNNVTILGLRITEENSVCTLNNATLLDESSNITVQRLSGFLEAAIAAEHYLPEEQIWSIPDNNRAYAYQAAKQALSAESRPDLLLCMSDRIALSAIKAARDLGLSVPNDVMITGFDGIDETAESNPSLTTIEQPSMDKGRVAAEIFLGIREENNVVLNAPLRVRESCPGLY